MMVLAEFPRALLREASHSWNLAGEVASPGLAQLSFAPVVRSDGGGFWSCTMTDVALSGGLPGSKDKARQRESTLLWRAVRQICDGGSRSIVVPRNDALFVPWPAGAPRDGGLSLHSDDTAYTDGAGYYQPTIAIKTASAAGLRSTTLHLRLVRCAPLLGGESFSILHPTMGWRLYEIAALQMVADDEALVRFSPPLREDVQADVDIEFDRPRCVMRLATPDAMNLSIVPWTFNRASVSFIEALTQ